MSRALVIAEHRDGKLSAATGNTLGAATALGLAAVDLLILGRDPSRLAAEARSFGGLDRILCIENSLNEPYLAAIWAPQIAGLAGEYTHFLGPSTTFGKDLMPHLAGLLEVGMLSDVSAIEGPFLFQRPCYAGNVLVRIEADPERKLCLTVRTTAFTPPDPAGEPLIETVSSACAIPGHTRFVASQSGMTGGADLQTARRVVAGGRGVGGKESFAEIAKLASLLNAALGASRAAVDAGWVANELQVGQTGKIIGPELYIAIGISGAIQHLTGIRDAGTVVAINSDKEAPICQAADIVLIADLLQAVPELIASLESRRQHAQG